MFVPLHVPLCLQKFTCFGSTWWDFMVLQAWVRGNSFLSSHRQPATCQARTYSTKTDTQTKAHIHIHHGGRAGTGTSWLHSCHKPMFMLYCFNKPTIISKHLACYLCSLWVIFSPHYFHLRSILLGFTQTCVSKDLKVNKWVFSNWIEIAMTTFNKKTNLSHRFYLFYILLIFNHVFNKD